jgi:hypothetical protein
VNQRQNQSPRSIKVWGIAAIAFIITLSGCSVGPTRADNPDAFKVLLEGKVQPAKVSAFTDCVLDGFDKSRLLQTRISYRQQRRADSYRVEALAGGRILLISVDAFDNGRVVFNESTSAGLINTSGEREIFLRCAKKFSIEP